MHFSDRWLEQRFLGVAYNLPVRGLLSSVLNSVGAEMAV